MSVKFKIDRDSFGEEGIAFIGDKNEDLYFIPKRHIYRIEHNYKVLGKYEIGDVLLQIIQIYKMDWASTELLNDLAKFINNTGTNINPDIFADTYRAINEFKKIEILTNEFVVENSRQVFSTTNAEKYYEWKERLKKYISENYHPNLPKNDS
jgi:hypothetical protein